MHKSCLPDFLFLRMEVSWSRPEKDVIFTGASLAPIRVSQLFAAFASEIRACTASATIVALSHLVFFSLQHRQVHSLDPGYLVLAGAWRRPTRHRYYLLAQKLASHCRVGCANVLERFDDTLGKCSYHIWCVWLSGMTHGRRDSIFGNDNGRSSRLT